GSCLQGIVPESVHLTGFTCSWGHRPFPDFCIHPGQLRSLPNKVIRIHAYSKICATRITGYNLLYGIPDIREEKEILRISKILVQGMNKPERSIHCIVNWISSESRESIGNQASPAVSGKIDKSGPCLLEAVGN